MVAENNEKVDYSRRIQMDVLYINKQVSYSFLLFNLSFKDRKIDRQIVCINGKLIVLIIQRYIGANCTDEDPRYGSKYIYK